MLRSNEGAYVFGNVGFCFATDGHGQKEMCHNPENPSKCIVINKIIGIVEIQ